MSNVDAQEVLGSRRRATGTDRPRKRRKKLVKTLIVVGAAVLLTGGGTAWLGIRAAAIKSDLEAAATLVPQLKQEILASNADSARTTVIDLRNHTGDARKAASDPIWSIAAGLPWLGANFGAIAEITQAADDVSNLGLVPLVNVYDSLDWDALIPSSSGSDLVPLKSAAPSVTSAAYAVKASSERLAAISTEGLLPQVSAPLSQVVEELEQASRTLDVAADAAKLAPAMLGEDKPRNYLLMIQNNAEARASGGIPGALAVITLEDGRLSLGEQSSAGELGTMSPTIAVDLQQQHIYSTRLGKYFQDVNLTPDFPTAAGTAREMWQTKTGHKVDGVISIDPVVLSYLLQATGPVTFSGPELDSAQSVGLPSELTGSNVVRTLLSDVYAKIDRPELQDAYFAGVAREVFSALSSGKGDAKGLLGSLTRGIDEGRVLLWSASSAEQSMIGKYPLGGSISGPNVSPAQFGVYFNDGTGAKMDYYVQRKVQLITECPASGYKQVTVRVTSTNTAPADAARSLPKYVTGGGFFGIPAGSVQTNIAAYGPAQAQVESAKADGQRIEFAPYLHGGRPVGVVAQQLSPGETKTVDFTFGKIVQHSEPALAVTPSVQPLRDVMLPPEVALCGEG